MYGVELPLKLKLSLVPVCIGVAMATINDFSFNMVSRQPMMMMMMMMMMTPTHPRLSTDRDTGSHTYPKTRAFFLTTESGDRGRHTSALGGHGTHGHTDPRRALPRWGGWHDT
jgi:hypothetical protein